MAKHGGLTVLQHIMRMQDSDRQATTLKQLGHSMDLPLKRSPPATIITTDVRHDFARKYTVESGQP